MNLKLSPPPIEISEDEGFSKNDLFSQKSFADKLTNLIENSHDELVIGFDSKWGEGKTTFIKMWKGMLEHERNIKCLYFDAFKNDYINDPFLSLAGELYSLIGEQEGDNKKEKFKKSAISAMKVIGKAGIRITAKVLTSGILDTNDVFDDDTDKDIANESSTLIDNYLSKRLDEVEKDKSSITEFKKYLSTLPNLIDSNNNIVIIIDELDRCSPLFALELLEKIKHIFSVKNIVFVLVTNRIQLENSIKNKYGHDTDSNEYLHKFVHVWVSFSNSKSDIDNRKKYLNYHLHRIDPDNSLSSLADAKEILSDLVLHYKLTLREIERVVTYFSLYINIIGNNLKYEYQVIPSYLCVIRTIFPSVYADLANGKIKYLELIERTKINNLTQQNWGGDTIEHHLLVQLLFDLSSSEEQRKLRQEGDYGKYYKLPTAKNIIKNTCDWFGSFNT